MAQPKQIEEASRRRLQLLRYLAKRGACTPQAIASGLRQLNKSKRQRVNAEDNPPTVTDHVVNSDVAVLREQGLVEWLRFSDMSQREDGGASGTKRRAVYLTKAGARASETGKLR